MMNMRGLVIASFMNCHSWVILAAVSASPNDSIEKVKGKHVPQKMWNSRKIIRRNKPRDGGINKFEGKKRNDKLGENQIKRENWWWDECEDDVKPNGKKCECDEECYSDTCSRSWYEKTVLRIKSKRCVQCATGNDCPLGLDCKDAGTTQAACGGKARSEIPGFDHVVSGYNIFKSTPLTPGQENDKGWDVGVITDVFNPDFSKAEEIFTDKEKNDYLVPSEYTIQDINSCTSTFSTTSIETSSSLVKEISESVNVGGEAPIPKTPVTIGVGVGQGSIKKWQSDAKEERRTSVSKNKCEHFEIKMNVLHGYPPLSKDMNTFLDGFDGSRESYYDLFDAAGTHVVVNAVLGSMQGVTSSFTSEQTKTLEKLSDSSSNSISVGAAGFFKFERSKSKSSNTAIEEAFAKYEENIVTWTVGSSTLSSVDAWEKDISKPDILSMDLTSICDVVDKKGFDKATCKSHYQGYCENRLDTTDCHVDDNIECIYGADCGDNGVCKKNQCMTVYEDFTCDDKPSENYIGSFKGYAKCMEECGKDPTCRTVELNPDNSCYLFNIDCTNFSYDYTNKYKTATFVVPGVVYPCSSDADCDSGFCNERQCMKVIKGFSCSNKLEKNVSGLGYIYGAGGTKCLEECRNHHHCQTSVVVHDLCFLYENACTEFIRSSESSYEIATKEIPGVVYPHM